MPAQRAILVVDDDNFARKCLREILTAHDYRVLEACNGAEALERLESETPDLILLDLMMPRASGIEVLQSLSEKRSRVPIIVVSCMDAGALVDQVLQSGARSFIAKPFHPVEIVEEIRHALLPPA